MWAVVDSGKNTMNVSDQRRRQNSAMIFRVACGERIYLSGNG
ncbi:MAG: hypothetical protein SPJ83_02440 [Helicobacter sp.]|nr:hypothetical protein [Helicobacter sp.]MDY5821647.1 hypothetical protein [Helicobacter sp.]